MKKTILILALFLALNAYGLEFLPNTVQEMDATITLKATGELAGTLTSMDSMEVRFLTFHQNDRQQVLEISEELEIDGKKFQPAYEFEGENKYAIFEVDNLAEYADNPAFTVTVIARLKKSAQIGLEEKQAVKNGEEFLKETKFIEVNDQELQSKADLEFTSEDDLETLREIAKWVKTNITYDFENYYNAVFSAKQTYNSRAGVCDEFANLSAAFARIKGIPAKYVTGISFDGELFANHGWNEVMLKDYGWVGLDSTFGEAGFVDAAHFELAKTADASESVNFTVTTRTANTVNVTTSLALPEVEINKVKFFQGVTSAFVEAPQRVYSGQEFTVKAKLKNLLEKKAVIPVEIALHKDFSIQERERLEIFGPLEEKEITWVVRAPVHQNKKTFLRYGMFFLAPDQNVSKNIEVHFSEETFMEGAKIVFSDISPRVSGDTLFIDVKIANTSTESGTAKITAIRESQIAAGTEVELPGLSEKTETISVGNFSFGEIELRLESGTEEKTVRISVPKEEEKPIEVTEEPQKPAEENEFAPDEKSTWLVTVALGAVITMIVILALVQASRAFLKK
ncbi:MAG: transglutaminase domain-containing protein [Candidatus Diapherotrites archaeon]|nr:transglutaminase domain-containing protein [Candidatus Diapherotrites archaeon]